MCLTQKKHFIFLIVRNQGDFWGGRTFCRMCRCIFWLKCVDKFFSQKWVFFRNISSKTPTKITFYCIFAYKFPKNAQKFFVAPSTPRKTRLANFLPPPPGRCPPPGTHKVGGVRRGGGSPPSTAAY